MYASFNEYYDVPNTKRRCKRYSKLPFSVFVQIIQLRLSEIKLALHTLDNRRILYESPCDQSEIIEELKVSVLQQKLGSLVDNVLDHAVKIIQVIHV